LAFRNYHKSGQESGKWYLSSLASLSIRPTLYKQIHHLITSRIPTRGRMIPNMKEEKESPSMVVVMGVTGAGKSYFINKLAGKEVVKEGPDLESCRQIPPNSSYQRSKLYQARKNVS
jgi:ABC-type uncharacterized transport system ATPase component